MFFLLALIQGLAADSLAFLPFLVVPVVLAIVGYQFMKRMVFNLVDEVFDLGDALLVRSGGQEERIALADIKNLVAAAAERVWRHGCVLCADGDDAAVAKPIIVRLIDRIDAARRER